MKPIPFTVDPDAITVTSTTVPDRLLIPTPEHGPVPSRRATAFARATMPDGTGIVFMFGRSASGQLRAFHQGLTAARCRAEAEQLLAIADTLDHPVQS